MFIRTCWTPALLLASTTSSTENPSGNPLSTALKPACLASKYLPVIVGLSPNINDILLANFIVIFAPLLCELENKLMSINKVAKKFPLLIMLYNFHIWTYRCYNLIRYKLTAY